MTDQEIIERGKHINKITNGFLLRYFVSYNDFVRAVRWRKESRGYETVECACDIVIQEVMWDSLK